MVKDMIVYPQICIYCYLRYQWGFLSFQCNYRATGYGGSSVADVGGSSVAEVQKG